MVNKGRGAERLKERQTDRRWKRERERALFSASVLLESLALSGMLAYPSLTPVISLHSHGSVFCPERLSHFLYSQHEALPHQHMLLTR